MGITTTVPDARRDFPPSGPCLNVRRTLERVVQGWRGGEQEQGVIRRDRLLWIGERHEVVLGDLAVARESGDEVDLASDDGVVHERRLHLPLLPEGEAVGLAKSAPFR